jgi:hypothetical protein
VFHVVVTSSPTCNVHPPRRAPSTSIAWTTPAAGGGFPPNSASSPQAAHVTRSRIPVLVMTFPASSSPHAVSRPIA